MSQWFAVWQGYYILYHMLLVWCSGGHLWSAWLLDDSLWYCYGRYNETRNHNLFLVVLSVVACSVWCKSHAFIESVCTDEAARYTGESLPPQNPKPSRNLLRFIMADKGGAKWSIKRPLNVYELVMLFYAGLIIGANSGLGTTGGDNRR